ncbi:hypothetical protein [Afipia clevelandensis]|uniref:Uncharacterized protein n=1 Tax=Afipia clevelandensis ATCC 49720 TaxID=883079 RepID=K8PAV2_9BRAD|nr:hypothetical protein [Afipia clevelandensis]EKS35493.1 hypothetical protein HMPREF9696_02328 [Afipia clevelandensis ATCC 49720]
MLPRMLHPSPQRWMSITLAVLCGLSIATSRLAHAEDDEPVAGETTPADVAVPPDSEIDWSILNGDPRSIYETESPAAIDRKVRAALDDPWSWSRNDRPDGSSAVAIKQPVSPFLNTQVGADITVAGRTPTVASEVLLRKIDNDVTQSSGSAWAAITAPGVASVWDKTAVEARTDPGQEQSRLATLLTKSVPFGGDRYSLTLQQGYNVTQQTLVPLFGLGASQRIYESEQTAKLGIVETGTTFIAGQTHSSADDKWLRRVAAEQKFFGGLLVTGSVSETPSGFANSSLSAGFKARW